MSRLKELHKQGQSFWLDNLGRGLLRSGALARLVKEDGARGVTSNPAIFEKSIGGSHDYADTLRQLAPQAPDAKWLYEQLAVRDIQDAADVLRPVYDESGGQDGFVSLEVSPELAHDQKGSVEEARRLWKEVGKPNLLIKIPATAEGISAIEQLVGEGMNINVTLLFALDAYEKVALAYIAGLEKHAAAGGDLKRSASVASFFVSRVDVAVDEQLQEKIAAATGPQKEALKQLLGKAAIANARLAYKRYQELFAGERWQALVAKGACTQRVLWASTGMKSPAYRDVTYVEELVGPDTVNTMPPATVDAFRDHGVAEPRLTLGLDEATATLKALEDAGVSMRQVTDKLLADGLRLFTDAFEKLLAATEKARAAAR
jgi:transaldolase/glucose-6-phosphate isomerase